ncbi:hypothetical protein HYDPIDRAFT_161442 [Hydnomerulius pinastri MD-312]|uniref:MYND-type domain-containing protein n=1 Tax=Hydnomerulius pinastri MD-312 TaxID=994086 RepID=A0A0C9V442_9AGAM|nr:hypothetical protein HYDPIDRAFT_161442 [Hydnomerulius pinastri MD-312]
MDDLHSIFSGLPGYSPMMMINKSEACAATKLIQCRDFGVYMSDVSEKFQRSPQSTPDLTQEEFMARKKIIQQVEESAGRNRGKRGMVDEWAPILYRYEVVKGSAKRQCDWGHLLFTDMTTTRFLLVMVFPRPCNCGNLSHNDYETLTKYQADRLMCLLTYLHHDEGRPQFVRATYVTPTNGWVLDPEYLASFTPPKAPTKDSKFAPIIHVTPNNFVPSLLPGDLEKIDNLLARKSGGRPPQSVRSQVMGGKETRPDVSSAWRQRNPRQCAYCEALGEKNLRVCGRCKLVQYCGAECQKAAWPSHKVICKKADA